MTAPRWIAEAIAAAHDGLAMGDCPGTAELAAALIERLPLAEIEQALRGIQPGDWSGGVLAVIIGALTDDPEVVTLTEFYQGACRTLDAAGVPYGASAEPGTWREKPLDLAGRIRWLAQQRPTRLDLQRVEAERDQLRKMYEGASADLDRERREHQDAEGAAANREIGAQTALAGARERIAALEGEVEILHESLDAATGDAEHNERELIDLRRRFDDLQRERDRMARDLNQLQGDLDTTERKLRDTERELQRARY